MLRGTPPKKNPLKNMTGDDDGTKEMSVYTRGNITSIMAPSTLWENYHLSSASKAKIIPFAVHAISRREIFSVNQEPHKSV